MLNPFPVVSALNFISVVLLAACAVHLYFRAKKPLSQTMQTFLGFFVSVWMVMAILTIDGILVRDLAENQILSNISDIFFYSAVALFLRVIFLFTAPQNRLGTIILPIACFLLGIFIFLWEMFYFVPAQTFLIEVIAGYPFIFYTNEAPLATQLISGAIGFIVFMGAAVIFLRQAMVPQERALRLRSLLLGVAFIAGTLGSVFDFIFSTSLHAVAAFFIAAILLNISFVLAYAGVLIHARTE